MPTQKIKTPGVYIEEKSAFPNSVVEAPSAAPAFVGYTETANRGEESLRNMPTRITSMSEFERYFGGPPATKFTFSIQKNGGFELTVTGDRYYLHHSLQLFFDNGGGSCHIVSVGSFSEALNKDAILGGLNSLAKAPEPTILVAPDAVLLAIADWQEVCLAMLEQCGQLQSRIAILDVYNGYQPRTNDPDYDVISGSSNGFRSRINSPFLKFGVCYFPWLHTSIVGAQEVSFGNIANRDALIAPLSKDIDTGDDKKNAQIRAEIDKLNDGLTDAEAGPLHRTLCAVSPLYNKIMTELQKQLNLLPPSGAMAGVYTRMDNSRGVHTAPANTGLISVAGLTTNISDAEQSDLNVPLDGKAINAIRTFAGRGVLIWGARTLDANSQDWRYINVRRLFIVLEQSIKNALAAFAFEPNTAATWTVVDSMISNYLFNKWKQGALTGAKPDQAFSVRVGLGTTMTQQDIFDGYMRVQVQAAVIRPAEFMVLRFVQKMSN